MASFVKDVEEIRQRAISRIEDGPVTATYKGDKNRTIAILNEALATEIVCVLRYMHHYFMATGVHGRSVANEFKEHADAEREHSEEIADRIQQLGGKPDYNPASLLQRSVSQYKEGEDLGDMIREDLIAERMVIEVYQEMIRYFGNNDPTTRTMIEHILSEEEDHASDLSDLLYVVDPHTGEAEGRDPGADPLAMRRAEKQVAHASLELEEDEYEPGPSQDDNAMRDRLASRWKRQPNVSETVRGRDREYDGTQEVRDSGSRRRNSSATSKAERGASAGTPGASGRPMNRRKTNEEVDEDEIAERPNRGGMSGGTRSPKILQKNRKNRRVA
jgi:bacterioferritin